MLLNDFCSRIYFWPFISYLASLKGLCPYYPPDNITTTTLAPIPTFQPTPTPPTTLPPCPADPLVCLPGGERPIPYCPCIDPRLQNGPTTTASATILATTSIPIISSERLQSRLDLSNPVVVMDTETMIFSHLDNSKSRRRRKTLQEGN